MFLGLVLTIQKLFKKQRNIIGYLSGCSWWGYYPDSQQDKIFSPDFVYHLVNYGVDNGSGFGDNMNVLEQIGCCTWQKMPSNANDPTSWPNEDAWNKPLGIDHKVV